MTLLTTSISAQAQSKGLDTGSNNSNYFHLYKQSRVWQLSLKPFQLIDPNAGTFQIGAEKKIADHFAVELDFGLPFHALSYAYKSTGRENYRYFKYCLEIKYLFTKNRKRNSENAVHYLALRALYFPQRYRLNNEFVWLDTAFYLYKTSDLKRNAWSVDVINGYELSKGRFVYNPYFGIGVRILQLNQHPYNLVLGNPANAVEDYSSHIYRYIGNFYRPDFVLGIRLGYRLGK